MYFSDNKEVEKLNNLSLIYQLKENRTYSKHNAENYEEIKALLKSVGVSLTVNDNVLNLSFYGETFLNKTKRSAGRKKTLVWNGETRRLWRYSDIVYMLQFMNDKEICDKIEMSPSTYYRHKKTLKDSDYYKSLDLNKLCDKEYLESVDLNRAF